MRARADIAELGRENFKGSLAHKNRLWRAQRNFVRQGLSNFEGSLVLPNRSACLLLYYSALNLAKAEMLPKQYAKLVDKRIGHGLSFNPASARTVKGDTLRVMDNGVFSLLYEHRTGGPIPPGTRLPISRLVGQVPEIGSQAGYLKVASRPRPVFQLLASDDTECWVLLAVEQLDISSSCASSRLLRKHFREVAPPTNWRDHFGFSRRYQGHIRFFESLQTVPTTGGAIPQARLQRISWQLRGILSNTALEWGDAWLTPYIHETTRLSMPASLARYALLFYASSLVRYKPSMFDAQLHPEQALLFDAIARECALPLLVDSFAGVTDRPQIFYATDSFRV
jgi:hypothetical protein